MNQQDVIGYHSEWNLGSPGGWDYQRITQNIGKAVWDNLSKKVAMGVELNFEHPLFYPVHSFVDMLLEAHRSREGSNPGLERKQDQQRPGHACGADDAHRVLSRNDAHARAAAQQDE